MVRIWLDAQGYKVDEFIPYWEKKTPAHTKTSKNEGRFVIFSTLRRLGNPPSRW